MEKLCFSHQSTSLIYDRKAYMQAQFDQLFLDNTEQAIHFFKAINGKENPNHLLFQRYNEKKRLNVKG